MRKHEEVLEEIRAILMDAGPTTKLSISQLGDVDPCAENASELEFLADDGQWYVLSIIERDT